MKRKFTLDELAALDLDEWDHEQINASTRWIYLRAEGKTWRISTKTNTDGEDEVQQSLAPRLRKYGGTWDDEEVELREVKVKRWVPV